MCGRILNSVHNIIRASISRFLLLRFFFFFFDFPVSFLFFSRKLLEKVSENYFFQVPSRQHFLSVQRLPDYSMTRKIDKDKNIYIILKPRDIISTFKKSGIVNVSSRDEIIKCHPPHQRLIPNYATASEKYLCIQ